MAEELKKGSTKWLKVTFPSCRGFSWQFGYAIFSADCNDFGGTVRYIQDQVEHHKKVSFREELLELLNESGTEYDERYLWD